MIKDTSFLIISVQCLGTVRMMCKNILKTMLKEHVQYYVEHALEADFEHCVQDIDYDECVDYVVHACKRRQCVQLR